MSNLGTHRRCVCMLSSQADVSKLLGSGAASALDLVRATGPACCRGAGLELGRSAPDLDRIGLVSRDGARVSPSGHQSGGKIVASMNVLAAPRRKTRSLTSS